MREVLFRAISERVNGRRVWIYGDYIKAKLYDIIRDRAIDEQFIINGNTVGQFTGVFDKNGNKVFEGDLLEFTYVNDKHLAEVLFGEYALIQGDRGTSLGFYVKFVEIQNVITTWANEVRQGHAVVVGNIHDNPELLGGGGDV
jgi:uncharacterized phage protein (TIGR01671 family)